MYTRMLTVVLLLIQGSCVIGQEASSGNLAHSSVRRPETDEIVIDEVQDVHVKQHILVDRNYNSSFTISVPMLSVIVPGTSRANGIVRLSISHITLWSLISISFVGLVYPIFLGPHGKLHRRSFDGQSSSDEAFRLDPTILDHIDNIVNTTQVYEDLSTLVPWEISQECLSRMVCEAHESVVDFGLAGIALRGVYTIEESGLLGATSRRTRRAARYGRNPNQRCQEIYSGCMISPLEMYKDTLAYLLKK